MNGNTNINQKREFFSVFDTEILLESINKRSSVFNNKKTNGVKPEKRSEVRFCFYDSATNKIIIFSGLE